MCRRELSSLQRGMNFNLGRTYSVILMSVRKNAPYRDSFDEERSTIIYEGHDVPKRLGIDPKKIDQVAVSTSGRETQNGLFYAAAIGYKQKRADAHSVRVYEKIREGIWSYNGLFLLVDAWQERSNGRQVFKFELILVNETDESVVRSPEISEHRRLIPTQVKLEVWSRDKGKCVICGSTTELHFDHDLPFSKGGTSLTVANVQLLCARHNLSKGAKII